jgi:hypothetical protein
MKVRDLPIPPCVEKAMYDSIVFGTGYYTVGSTTHFTDGTTCTNIHVSNKEMDDLWTSIDAEREMLAYKDYLEGEKRRMSMTVDYTKELEVYNVDNPDVGYKVVSSRELKGWNGNHSVIWEQGKFEYSNIFTKFGDNHDEEYATDYKYRVRNKKKIPDEGYIVSRGHFDFYPSYEAALADAEKSSSGYKVFYVDEIWGGKK